MIVGLLIEMMKMWSLEWKKWLQFLEISRGETGMPINGVMVPAMIVVGMVFPEGKVGSAGEEKDVGVMLDDTLVISFLFF